MTAQILHSLGPWLAPLMVEPAIIKRGRPCIGDKPLTVKERKKKHRTEKQQYKLDHVAILDMETDPFDRDTQKVIHPFLAVLYSDNFDPIIIWDENNERFIQRVIDAIENLPDSYTIYAHNGGKFDYMFLVKRLRGTVMFKGRGIMSAKIGRHELRDSFHIIPERLANWQKDDIDYSVMAKGKRGKHKAAIIKYCIADCRYLLDIVNKFVGDHGLKISIGQAAMAYLRKEYKVPRLGETMDGFLRQWFFGGRVECIQGKGHWQGEYKLYDVNSMYPHVMSEFLHPQGNLYTVHAGGRIGPRCAFLQLSCDNNGALVRRGENNETSGTFSNGQFFTTIHEYRVAQKYRLIDNVKIIRTVDCDIMGNFSRTIIPLYENRITTKGLLKALEKGTFDYNEAKKDDMVTKFLLNNMYGKFAQNPRKYKESYITEPNEEPECEHEIERATWGPLPAHETPYYWIWERPNPNLRFNNVGTAASITGAARAVLLEAIQNARDPIYCDTDSLICRDLRGVNIDSSTLGAWDIESKFSEVIITGKKQYACRVADLPNGHKDAIKLRSKGVSDMDWQDYVRMLDGEIIEKIAKAPTLTKLGGQKYMRRNIRATAPLINRRPQNRVRVSA